MAATGIPLEKTVTESDVGYRYLYLNKNDTYAAIVSNLSSKKKETLAKGEAFVEIPAVDANTCELYHVKLKDKGYCYHMKEVRWLLVVGKTVVFRWNNNIDALEVFH
ncbi:hypothetical protein V6N13_058009 [Hibiscus sabdariffa]|uniref:Uncharacterized protein n=1 Tax=Hibiscus sabdariffa TaxID=183260 RepID=A0ABR2GI55_9ROSI